MPQIELQIGPLPVHVRTTRLIAAALGRRLGLEDVVIDEVKLAVGEACSRAVSVHRAAGLSEPISILFRDDEDILEVSVTDCGPDNDQRPGENAAYQETAEAAAADLLRSATQSAREPADAERGIDVASLAPRLGLALITGLVDDMSVTDRAGSSGTVVTMRWPIVSF